MHSLERARVPKQYQREIIQELESSVGDRIHSRDIYEHINQYFNKKSLHSFAKYHLKMALMQLGPSGYPFERYVAALLTHYGYDCKVSQMQQGKCVTHEVDVVGRKGDSHYIVECKFHNQPGLRSDVKTALYVKARYDDIVERLRLTEGAAFNQEKHEGWLVTNTKCTSDAIQYALCAGINIIGWSFPEKGNLQDMVEEAGLYPITVLSTLSQSSKEYFLQKDIVLAKQLLDDASLLQELHLAPQEEDVVRQELQGLFSNETV